MNEPLENEYFRWLCAKVIQNKQPSTPSLTYWKLLNLLHSTEFAWIVLGDDNRAADGRELRSDFAFECKIKLPSEWNLMGCSVLEMLIAFSRRAEFDTDVPAHDWFWEFIENLNIKYSDAEFDKGLIEDALTVFLWRNYNKNGRGGLFPMDNPQEDQRSVEIWYQFAQYLVDQDRLP